MNKNLTVSEVRNRFLAFMESKGHKVVPSASIVPDNDPTTLFTGSGMQPMLPYLLGQPHPQGTRIADSQRCFRSQDIEEVGDNRHTTFFEMLGNWSFGDYFKDEQISWMFEFFVNEYNLDLNNFYVSCFAGNESLGVPRDTHSAELWQKLFKSKSVDVSIGDRPEVDGIRQDNKKSKEDEDKIYNDHIFYYDEKKNWWSRSGIPSRMPEGEPGGPDTEMFYDFDPIDIEGNRIYDIHNSSKWATDICHPNCDCGRFMEIGNNVFMQYKKVADGFEELPQTNVDHGSGLERWLAAIRNDADIFNIDVFEEAKSVIERLSGIVYDSNIAITFTDIKEPTFAYRVILDHIRAATFLIADGVLPGSKDQMYFVRRLLRRAIRFGSNLGIENNFCAQVAQTFIDVYAKDFSFLKQKSDIIIFEIEREETKFRLTLEKGMKQFMKIADNYNANRCSGCSCGNGTGDSGGCGNTISGEEAFDLLQTYGFPIELTCELAVEMSMRVDMNSFDMLKKQHASSSRSASEGKFKGGLGGDSEMEIKYHTATHMLHQALRQVLGDTVYQKGSNITTERLRFDFSFDRKVTDEEKKKVEDIINLKIKEALPVTREEVSMEEARSRGAIGLFGDKYGEIVSVYTIGQETGTRGKSDMFSLEFCGGPHVSNTSELGIFKIQKEEAVSAGVRRIKAVLEYLVD